MAQDWIENKLISDIKEGLWGEQLPKDLISIWGFPANSGREDWDRLYLSLSFNEYIEFPHSGLIHVEDAGGPDNPFSGSMIWLRKDTPVEHYKMQSLDLQRGFLQGDIAGSHLNTAQASTQNATPATPGAGGGAGTFVCTGAGTLVCTGAGTLVCTGAGTLVCTGAGTLVCTGAGTLVCTGAGPGE